MPALTMGFNHKNYSAFHLSVVSTVHVASTAQYNSGSSPNSDIACIMSRKREEGT